MEKFQILTERLFLRSPNINVCFRIIIEGRIEQKRFDAAMADVSKRHPLLNCSIEIDNNRNAWFIPNAGHFEIEYYNHVEMPDWLIWYRKIDETPFDFSLGPLVKICVITHDSQSEIIILGHHVIADGIGFLNLSKDVLLALDNKLETTPQLPPDNIKFRKCSKLGFIAKIYAKKLNKEWRKNRMHFTDDDYNNFFQDYRNKYSPRMYFYSISENEMEKLLEKCKNNILTVNELLTSAFAAALSNKGELRIGVALNTRNEIKAKPFDCMCNYISGISVKVNLVENDFILNTKIIVTAIRKQLNNMRKRHLAVNFLNEFDGDLIESIMYASYGDHQLPIPKQIGTRIAEGFDGKGLGISNLGKFELNNYETLRVLDMQFIGPVFPANLLSVSVITVNKKLNICLRYNENEIKSEDVTSICKKAIAYCL